MKAIKVFATVVAFISSSIFVGCEDIKSFADIDINTTDIVDIPVQLVDEDMKSCEFAMSLADIDDLNKYLDKIKYLNIEDVELSVLNYQGDEFNGDITMTVDGETLWSRDDVNPDNIGTISLKEESTLDTEALTNLGVKLLIEKEIKGGVVVETENTEPVSASFTVRCKFIFKITANALN